MTSVTLTWHVLRDGHPICPICLDIDGYDWVFEVGKDVFPNELVHPVHGVVWNTTVGSEVHARHGILFQCKCGVEPKFEFADFVDRIKNIADQLEGSVAEGTVKADVFR